MDSPRKTKPMDGQGSLSPFTFPPPTIASPPLPVPSPALTPSTRSPSPPSLAQLRVAIQDSPSSATSPSPSISAARNIRSPPNVRHSSSRSVLSFLSGSRTPSTVFEDGNPRTSPFSSSETLGSVRSYRSTSSNSPVYMFKNPMKSSTELPFEQAELSDEDFEVYSKLASEQQVREAPATWVKWVSRSLYALFLLSLVYFVFVGFPLWDGVARLMWHFLHSIELQEHFWGMLVFVLMGTVRNALPQFFCTFDRKEPDTDTEKPRDASECCIIIPCYKAAETLRSTLPACLQVFGPEQIFVVANGNSPTPLDHTADICREFGVNHTWVPVGSKITAEFVGVALARKYKYCMLIDDDVLLPSNLPLPTHMFGDVEKDKIACVGYTIKSVGPESSRGTIIQQVQDIEYKVAGLAKVFQSHYGSVIFPHGAIALWRRDVLEKVFHAHPGYHISEDWFLGHTARSAGYRMVMSSQVFVETETPPRLFPSLFASKGGSRGGYGEMSIYKQRFFRWNFFFVFRVWSNMMYLTFSWRLGWRELFTKLWVFGEIYDTLIFLTAPLVLPISLASNWSFTLIVMGTLLGFNFFLVLWFNLIHVGLLRRGRPINERIPWIAFPAYMWLKFIMMFVNVASVYWAIYEYAFFFTRQHLCVTENVPAWTVIRRTQRNESSG
ncbi:glycosyl group 2 family [Fusarium heterosporum]|uniref:Glycosyl group 2 family n=1 Tax=Fusarium heterosporum TaxID=42747 RepID=A0A8H5WPY1_FUSHE|nr:glycosyl group 2 family [Fusarium heterosporum]